MCFLVRENMFCMLTIWIRTGTMEACQVQAAKSTSPMYLTIINSLHLLIFSYNVPFKPLTYISCIERTAPEIVLHQERQELLTYDGIE